MNWFTSLISRFGLACGAVVAWLMLSQYAIATPVEDLDAAMAMPVASDLVGAAQAERFAWVENVAGVRNIWIGGPDETARPVTTFRSDDGFAIYDLTLSPDGKRLAFVRGGDGEFADGAIPNPGNAAQLPQQQVMILNLAGGSPRVIGQGQSPVFAPDGKIAFIRRNVIWLWQQGQRAREIAQVRGSIGNLRFSPDGKQLLFVNNRGDHAYTALYEIGSPRVRYISPGLSFAADPTFSPDGTKVAFIKYREPPARGDDGTPSYWSIEVADAATGDARTAWRAPAGKGGRYAGTRQQNLFWTADNRLLFPWERTGWLHVYEVAADGTGRADELTSGEFEVETFMLDPDGRSLLFVGNVAEPDRHRLWRVARGKAPERVSQSLGIESYPAIAGRAVALIATDEDSPAYVGLATSSNYALRPELSLRGAVVPISVTFRADDGATVYAQLYEGRGAGPRPALVYLHGGPRRQMLTGFHPSSYYSKAYILNQHFAAQGYTVLSVNYRSGTGYGLAFRDAPGIARDGASEYRDVIAAGRWLAERKGEIDPSRIGVWGGSWGGYLTALALARDSSLFAAGVDFHGVHTMLRDLPPSLSPAEQIEARQLQWDSSPFGALDTWKSPVLIIHGDDDANVPFFQSPLLARELTARGVPFEELVFPDERHSFLRHSNWLASYHATADFLDRHVKQRATTP